jgi:hypothetical protein
MADWFFLFNPISFSLPLIIAQLLLYQIFVCVHYLKSLLTESNPTGSFLRRQKPVWRAGSIELFPRKAAAGVPHGIKTQVQQENSIRDID